MRSHYSKPAHLNGPAHLHLNSPLVFSIEKRYSSLLGMGFLLQKISFKVKVNAENLQYCHIKTYRFLEEPILLLLAFK